MDGPEPTIREPPLATVTVLLFAPKRIEALLRVGLFLNVSVPPLRLNRLMPAMEVPALKVRPLLFVRPTVLLGPKLVAPAITAVPPPLLLRPASIATSCSVPPLLPKS